MAGEIYLSNLSGQFDYQSILEKYQKLKSIQLENLYAKEQAVLQKKSAYDAFYGIVKDLAKSFDKMTDPLLVDSKTATISDESVATLKVIDESKLEPTSLKFNVRQLAQEDVWISQNKIKQKDGVAVASESGKIKIEYQAVTIGGEYIGYKVAEFEYDTDVNDGSKPSSLQEIADKINELQDEVTATVFFDGFKYKLMLKGNETGYRNRIKITETGDGDLLDKLALGEDYSDSHVQKSKNAFVKVYGQLVQSTTNTFTNIIEGLEFTLAPDSKGKTATITVGNDKEKIADSIEGFVNTFNQMVDFINQYTSKDGELSGDSTLQSVRSMIMRNFDPFYERGLLEVDRYTGKVSLNKEKLEEMVDNNPEDLKDMLRELDERLTPVMKIITDRGGIVDSRIDAYDRQINRIERDLERTAKLIDAEMENLKRQFIQLDSFTAQMNDIKARLAAFNPPKVDDGSK
jgi:flagellar hook-associated protein 2